MTSIEAERGMTIDDIGTARKSQQSFAGYLLSAIYASLGRMLKSLCLEEVIVLYVREHLTLYRVLPSSSTI